MGCLQTKELKPIRRNSSKKKSFKDETVYSWDNKEKVDPKDYTIANLKNETIGKVPGSINGNQFIIDTCENANLFLLDHLNTVTVDNCKGCNIVLGPTKRSVYLRDCEDCRFVISCQQLRLRDCKRVDIFLCCATQPVIETSREIRFGCYCYDYEKLESQFSDAGLSVDARIDDFLPIPTSDELSQLQINIESTMSLVPQTSGLYKASSKDNALVVFFSDGQSSSRAMKFISEAQSSLTLIRTKEVILDQQQAKLVFGTDSYNNVITKNPVIALHYNGEECIPTCQSMAVDIATESGSTGLVYISSNSRSANRQIEDIFNVDIHMTT
ncbi:Protein XRP2 [Nymphon striatum]|nr:Protein XRP2 [Nymphon striatum]